VLVLTPRSTVAAIQSGYNVLVARGDGCYFAGSFPMNFAALLIRRHFTGWLKRKRATCQGKQVAVRGFGEGGRGRRGIRGNVPVIDRVISP